MSIAKTNIFYISRECDVFRCLDEFTALEHMDVGELVSCERCNRQRRCTKELSIVKMPTVLILRKFKYQIGFDLIFCVNI